MPTNKDHPKGWRWVALSDVAQMESGHTPSRNHPEYWGGDIPWISVKDARLAHGKRLSETEEYTNSLGIANSSARLLPAGTVCLSRGGTVGYVVILDRPMATSQGFANWICGPQLIPEFLQYLLLAEADALEKFSIGTTIKTIYYPDLKAFHVCLPPLAEQKRIVALLDEAFAGIDAAKAKAESNWRDANTLFASRLEEIFAQAGLGWTQMRMEEVVAPDCSLSYGIVQPGDDFSEGMPVVRPTDLTSNVIYLSGLKRIDPKLAEGYARTTLQGGELLLCVRGSTGAVSIASEELAGANVTRGIVPIRFNKAMVLPDFGFYLISGGPVQAQIQEKTYGTALMQINIRDLRLISVSIPPLSEQNEIAQKMTDFHAKVQALTDLYERKASSFASLRNSLLTQAFAGELTA